MDENIKKAILEVRDLGETNMFDLKRVQLIALRLGHYDLAEYIQENPKEYANFILRGKRSKK